MSRLVAQSFGRRALRVEPAHRGRWWSSHLVSRTLVAWHPGWEHGVGASIRVGVFFVYPPVFVWEGECFEGGVFLFFCLRRGTALSAPCTVISRGIGPA